MLELVCGVGVDCHIPIDGLKPNYSELRAVEKEMVKCFIQMVTEGAGGSCRGGTFVHEVIQRQVVHAAPGKPSASTIRQSKMDLVNV